MWTPLKCPDHLFSWIICTQLYVAGTLLSVLIKEVSLFQGSRYRGAPLSKKIKHSHFARDGKNAYAPLSSQGSVIHKVRSLWLHVRTAYYIIIITLSVNALHVLAKWQQIDH